MGCITHLIIFIALYHNCYCKESFTEETLVCEDNTTCSSSDEILNSTESTILVTSTEEFNTTNDTDTDIDNITVHSVTPRKDTVHNACFCNLEAEICDIDCCCDEDCNFDQKLIFSSCQTGLSNSYDPKYCYAVDYLYINKSPAPVEVIHNELFCVMSTNLPPSYIIQASKPINTISEAERLISKYKKWPEMKYVEHLELNISEVLKMGNNIWIRYNNSKVEPFYLPQSMLTNVCLTKKPMKFLDNFKSSCSHMINEDLNEYLYPQTYYDFTIIAFNSSLNFSLIEDISQECPKNICLPVTIHLCDENLIHCDHVEVNDTKLSYGCHFSLYSSEQSCLNLVKKVKYIFYHNGTEGFTNISLHLHLTNITFYISEENEQFEQYFEVIYEWYMKKENYSASLSGNPGYLIGKPVLSANVNFSSLNETIDDKKIEFIKNAHSAGDNFLILPTHINGYCILNNESYKLVDFGYNLRFFCKENFIMKNLTNDTMKICMAVQKRTLELWEISLEDRSYKYVASFGNSNRYKIDEWVEIMYKFNLNETLEKMSSKLIDENTVLCIGLINKLKINILYSNVDFEKEKNQKKILNVFFEFVTVNNIFLYNNDKNNNAFTFDFKIYIEVMFYDVTAPKLQKFVDPPSLKIRLPRDFFYPFISNSTINYKKNMLIIIISFLFIIFST